MEKSKLCLDAVCKEIVKDTFDYVSKTSGIPRNLLEPPKSKSKSKLGLQGKILFIPDTRKNKNLPNWAKGYDSDYFCTDKGIIWCQYMSDCYILLEKYTHARNNMKKKIRKSKNEK